MHCIQSWKWKVISTFIIVTCQALQQEIGEECTNENGINGFCQLKKNCSKNTDLGAICNLEQAIICCATNIIKNKEPSNSSNDQKEEKSIQSRFGFFPSFFHASISTQNPILNINFFNNKKQKVPNLISNVLHQSLNPMKFVEERPIQQFKQDTVNTFHSSKNDQNLNIEIISGSDKTTTRPTRRPQNYETQRQNQNSNTNNPNYQFTHNKNPNYITQTPNQNQNNNNRPYHQTFPGNQNSLDNNNYPSADTQRPNQNLYNNINRPHHETYQSNQNSNLSSEPHRSNQNQNDNNNFYHSDEIHQSNQNNNVNRNPNYYTSTQKPKNNLSTGMHENNSQLPKNQAYSNSFQENKKPNQYNYHPTSSSILFPNDSNDDKSHTIRTTTTNKYDEYENRTNENSKRISEIKCEEYSKTLTTTISVLPLSIDTVSKPVSIEKCNSKSVGLIVGGTKAELGEFPHMVAIGFRTASGSLWNCGGTLISEKFVLTAAHCTHSALGNPVRVRLGELNLQKSNDGANPIDFLVDEVIVHPDYIRTSKYNDIALLRLDGKVIFNNHIRPACLYNNDIYLRKVTATGWGSIEYGDRSSDDLLKVDLDVIDNQRCNKLYEAESKTSTLNRGIIDSMLCAGDLAGGHDTCLGDSGGPLVIRSEKNACIFNLIGITSFGKFCATENSPGVYTRVLAFLPWIEQIVWA